MSVFSGIYGAVVNARNSRYDKGVLRVTRLQGPVVSVGNISVGGAGKTPFTILLGELLKKRGIEFDVISRGYGRKTQGVLEITPDGSPLDFGDEPLLIARSLNVPVIVGEKRVEAGQYAEQKYGPRLHLLDDAFQHRQLARDFDIVMVSPEDLRDSLLPMGRLREPVSSLKRADALVVPAGTDDSLLSELGKPIWGLRRTIIVPDTVPRTVIAFCGIARPERFFAELNALGISPARNIAFGDHHRYREADVRRLLREQQRTGADGFITTEKDRINLGMLAGQLPSLSLARMRMELQEADEAIALMMRTIESRTDPRQECDSASKQLS